MVRAQHGAERLLQRVDHMQAVGRDRVVGEHQVDVVFQQLVDQQPGDAGGHLELYAGMGLLIGVDRAGNEVGGNRFGTPQADGAPDQSA
ncbi:hypothetical protein SDC9_143274 [bioreactor metagenome]|uniref:Uncharacterized protein n=1 Tax=bioreactor metagenome TaxID=1076179 RepID=A0A645E339_9ZZZZ